MNYGDLRDQIRNYAELDSNMLSDTTVSIIVQNTENRIYRELNIDAYKLYASAVTISGTSTISVPSGLRNIRYVEMIDGSGTVANLLEKDSSYLAEYSPTPGSSTYYAEPKYYATWNDTTWFVAPTPDSSYIINIAYYKQPATITSGATSTSYVSVYAQDLLLYGSLVETYKYIKGPDNMIAVYEQSYQQAKQSFGIEQVGRRRRDEYLDGEVRILPQGQQQG
jgi:hypothetical protein